MYVPHAFNVQGGKKTSDLLVLELQNDCEPPCRCWKPNQVLCKRAARALNYSAKSLATYTFPT